MENHVSYLVFVGEKFKDYTYWNLNGVKSVERLLILHGISKRSGEAVKQNTLRLIFVAKTYCFHNRAVEFLNSDFMQCSFFGNPQDMQQKLKFYIVIREFSHKKRLS